MFTFNIFLNRELANLVKSYSSSITVYSNVKLYYKG